MFTIPNLADAAFDPQAYPNAVDIAILVQGIAGEGVEAGCAVTAQGSPDMTVAVAAGTVVIAGVGVTVTGGNVTITTAHATLHRRDLVVVNNSGTKSVVAGTPGNIDPAVGPLAVLPAVPANSVALAAVEVPAADTTINTNQITDKRAIVPAPVEAVGVVTIRKAANETVSATEVPQNDDHLTFAVGANETWLVRYVLYVDETTNSNITLDMGVPAAATYDYSTLVYNEDTLNPVAVKLHNTSSLVLAVHATNDFTMIFMEAVVIVGANAGSVVFKFARGSAAGSVTVKAGSHLFASKV